MELRGENNSVHFIDDESAPKLKRCQWEQDARFMSRENFDSWYNDPICF